MKKSPRQKARTVSRLALYAALQEQYRQMLAVANTQDWERLVAMEQEAAALVQRIEAAPRNVVAGPLVIDEVEVAAPGVGAVLHAVADGLVVCVGAPSNHRTHEDVALVVGDGGDAPIEEAAFQEDVGASAMANDAAAMSVVAAVAGAGDVGTDAAVVDDGLPAMHMSHEACGVDSTADGPFHHEVFDGLIVRGA